MPIDIDLSDPDLYADEVYADLMLRRERYIIMYGGRDSAKSYSAAQMIVYRMLHEENCHVVLLRKIYADIKESQFRTILDVIEDWGLEAYFRATKSPLEIVCVNGNRLMARGLDKPEKLKSIKDPTIIWIEEADEITLEAFIKTDLSIRGPEGCLEQMIMTFNPENESGWIPLRFFPPKAQYEELDGDFIYVDSTQDNTLIIHTTYKDNAYCPERREEILESLQLQDTHFHRIYALGLWGNALKGLVFTNVDYTKEFPDPEDRKYYGIGLDFGFTNDPTGLVECCLAHGEIYLRELCYKTGLVNTKNPSNPSLASIEAEFERLGIEPDDTIYADSAEPKSIVEIENVGYTLIGVKKPPGSIEASINQMKKYKINVVGGSPNAKKEFRSYRYKLDKDGNTTNVPIDAWNHIIDPARYWFMETVARIETEVFEVL